jgi:hypothetical protein
MRGLILLAGLLAAPTALAFAPAPLPPRSVATRLSCEVTQEGRVTDKVKCVAVTNRQALIHATRDSGYGRFTLTLESGEWPRRVRVVFRGYGSISGLYVEHGGYYLGTTSGIDTTRPSVDRKKPDGKWDWNVKEPVFEMPFRPVGDDLILDLPGNLLVRTEKTVCIHWHQKTPCK